MGADLLFSLNEIQATKEEALGSVERLFENGSLEDVLVVLEDHCGISRWYGEEPQSVEQNDVSAFLKQCVEEVYSASGRRDCASFTIDDNRIFYLTAGMSWGDTPTDCYESFVVCETFGLTLKPKV